MLRYIAGILLVIAFVLVSLYFFVGVPRVYQEDIPEVQAPHVYENPAESIEAIDIVALYFVPKNKTDTQIKNWQQVLQVRLEELVTFHQAQFLGRSTLQYQIYPTPIIGLEESVAYDEAEDEEGIVYDTEKIQHGNLRALRKIVSELNDRVFAVTGDKYRSDIASVPDNSYRVIFIMYEGVGGIGSGRVALLARTFLTGNEYQDFATTFLAHEFYHTLAVGDSYERNTGVFSDGQQWKIEILKSGDLMGRVRVPIENSYLNTETLRRMGL